MALKFDHFEDSNSWLDKIDVKQLYIKFKENGYSIVEKFIPEVELLKIYQDSVSKMHSGEIDVKNWTNLYLKERNKYLIDRDNNNLGKNFPIQPKGLFKKLRKVLPKNSAITLDAGTLCLQATDALEYYDPPSLFTPLDFGLVGFSFACGLGVKVAKPKKTVVSLMGDGGFGMTISELSTAVEYGINFFDTADVYGNGRSESLINKYLKPLSKDIVIATKLGRFPEPGDMGNFSLEEKF